jgi:hypothetical protein
MDTNQLVPELQKYERELNGILSRFLRSPHAILIGRGDDRLLRQYVLELVDLLYDSFGENRYSSLIDKYYTEGISNALSSPALASVENILAIVQAVLTRLNRNPGAAASTLPKVKTTDGNVQTPSSSDMVLPPVGGASRVSPQGDAPAQPTSAPAQAPDSRIIGGSLHERSNLTDAADATVIPAEWRSMAKELRDLSEKAERSLIAFRDALSEPDRFGIGGNNPPEAIRDSVAEGILAVKVTRDEVEANEPGWPVVELALFALKRVAQAVGRWIADMGSKFSSATAIAAGTAVGGTIGLAIAKQAGIDLGAIIERVEALLKVVGLLS